MHVGCVAQQDNPRAVELAAELRRNLDATVSIDAATGDALERDGVPVGSLEECDLVVSIGGDGTFLFTAQHVSPTPIMGVNLGEVGFLNVVPPQEAIGTVGRVVERIREGDATYQELPQVQADGESFTLPPAINEISMLGPQRGRGGGVGIEIRVDGRLYSGSHADGVLVATPTGSTAYNLSEDGPLLHPKVAAFVVTEMCAEGPMPPLAIPVDATVTVRLEAAPEAYVIADGRTRRQVTPPTSVEIRCAEHPVRIAGPPLEFFAALGKLE
ncbi:MAG: NAD(+)/NADH kinase [Natronomonas sp.]